MADGEGGGGAGAPLGREHITMTTDPGGWQGEGAHEAVREGDGWRRGSHDYSRRCHYTANNEGGMTVRSIF